MRKIIATTAIAATLLGGGAAALLGSAGSANAQSTTVTATDSTSGSTTATDTATSTSPVAVDPTSKLTTVLQPLVDAGTITASQRDAVVTALAAAGPIGGGRGMGGPGGQHGPGGRGGLVGEDLDVVAKALGIDSATLKTDLQGGKTIAAEATAKGVDVNVVIKALADSESAEIDQRVTNGSMTADQATTAKAAVTQRVTDMVNGVRPTGGHGMAPAAGSTTPASGTNA
jgi:hypothetical protein